MHQKSFLGHSPSGFHHIAYTEWGDDTVRPPVICVHGLTRNGRDFDRIAAALAKETRVFCPDISGRGKSDWLSDPALYSYPQYMRDMTAMIARTGAEQVDWVGTSMGGILGMFLAAQPNSPIRRLIVNDIGPFISKEALKRIGDYVGIMPEFADLDQAERYLRQIHAGFGITADDDWRHMAEHSTREMPNGKLTLNYDPAIAGAFKALEKDVDFWETYDRITCPILVIHGMESDILLGETAQEMMRRGPKAELMDVPGVGHAPALLDRAQTGVIEAFLHR